MTQPVKIRFFDLPVGTIFTNACWVDDAQHFQKIEPERMINDKPRDILWLGHRYPERKDHYGSPYEEVIVIQWPEDTVP